MPFSTTALLVVILGFALTAGLSAIAARSARHRADPTGKGPWWGTLAVGLGFLLAQFGLATPAFPPLDVTDRLPLLGLAGSIVAAILMGIRDRAWIRIVGFGALAIVVDLVMLGPVLGAGEFSEGTILQLATTAGIGLLGLGNLGWLDRPTHRQEVWIALVIVASGASVVLILSNSAVLFLLAATLAALLVSSLLASWGNPVGGGVPAAAAILAALVIEGSVYAFLPAIPAVLLAAAPASVWILRSGPASRFGPRARVTLAAGLTLIPVAVAVALAFASRTQDGYGI